jgi:hypothetical protein
MSEKILKKYNSSKKNKSSSTSSSSSSFSPEILEERNTARFPSYERYHSYRERLIERNGAQRYLNEGRIAQQQPEIVITSELYPNLNETTKRYIKQTFFLPDDRLNIFLQDHEKNIKVLKEGSIVYPLRQKIEKLFSSERFIPSSLKGIKPLKHTLKNTFRNNKYYIIINNNYFKIIHLFDNIINISNEHKNIVKNFENDLNKIFKTYNDKILNINNIIDFIIDLKNLLSDTNLLYITHIIDNQRIYSIYRYKILIAINTIIAYVLNYLIYHFKIYNNIDYIKNNNKERYNNNLLLFDITVEHNLKVIRFLRMLYDFYVFELFRHLEINLYNLNNPVFEYNKLFKFIVMTSLFFNYNRSLSNDFNYYRNNINLIIERIKNSNQIGGFK